MAGLQATFIIFLNFSTVNLVLLLQKKIILKSMFLPKNESNQDLNPNFHFA